MKIQPEVLSDNLNRVEESSYEFSGTHFLANYSQCKIGTLTNIEALKAAMTEAVKQSGATIIQMIDHVFHNEVDISTPGYTSIYLLSESHAAIHTYPEVRSCFIDIFTCGQKCSYIEFDKYLRNYLEPAHVSLEVLKRDERLQTLKSHAANKCLA
jgi:S-adenosylmethionine decarboxylase